MDARPGFSGRDMRMSSAIQFSRTISGPGITDQAQHSSKDWPDDLKLPFHFSKQVHFCFIWPDGHPRTEPGSGGNLISTGEDWMIDVLVIA